MLLELGLNLRIVQNKINLTVQAYSLDGLEGLLTNVSYSLFLRL